MDPSVESFINPAANLSATAVLSVIAIFLIRNLPKWIDQHFAAFQALAAEHRKEVSEASDRFTAELKAEREQCDRHHVHTLAQLEVSNANNLRAFERVCDSIAEHHQYAVQLATKLEAVNSRQKSA